MWCGVSMAEFILGLKKSALHGVTTLGSSMDLAQISQVDRVHKCKQNNKNMRFIASSKLKLLIIKAQMVFI